MFMSQHVHFDFSMRCSASLLEQALSGSCGGTAEEEKEREGPVGMACNFEFHIPYLRAEDSSLKG